MSKKMFKRSLALGALMAFVITGSAYAEPHKVHEKHSNWEVKETFYVFGEEGLKEDANFKISDLISYKGERCEHEGCGEYDYNTYDPDAPDTYVFNLNDKTFTVDGGIYIEGDILQVNGSAGSSLVASHLTPAHGTSINGDVELKLTSTTGNTIYRAENGSGSANINVNKIVINASNNAFQIHNDLFVGKDNTVGALEITAGGKAFNVAANDAGKGATLEIHANKLDVIKTTRASKAYAGSTLIVEAQEGNIATDFETASTGTVDLKFGSGVNWTGKLYTADGATKTALDLSGTWNLKDDVTDLQGKANSLTNATLRAGSTFVIDGKTYDVNEGSTVYALNGVGDKATLTVEQGAKLKIEGIKETTYNIAQGFTNLKDAEGKWEVSDINTLMQGVAWTSEKGLQVEVFAKEADTLADDMNVSASTAQSIVNVTAAAQASGAVANPEGTGDAKAVAFVEAMADAPSEVAGQAYEAVSKMAEAGGNSATAANVVNNVTNVTGQRLSFGGGGGHHGGHHGGNKGGHGVGLFEEGSGAAIWAQYVHGKDSVDGMESSAGTSSYEGQYNGIVMGVDFKKVGKFQSGIAFNYGEGDTNSVDTSARTRSDYDFWGIGYYGNIRNADTNFIFDVNYAKTESDVTTKALNMTYEASPETTTWTAGIKVEKLYQNNNVQIVPYAGLRFMSIDPEDYTTKCASSKYKMERQNIWLMPVGVSIRQDVVNNNGWTVSPKVDLSYIWAFGDTDSEMEFSTLDTKTPIQYEVMDEGSWMGLVGVEAAMDDWTFGVSYSYQKGDHSESKKWYVDAKYSF